MNVAQREVTRCDGSACAANAHIQTRTCEMCVSASVTGLAGGRSQKWTLSGGADPSGCARRRFRYMCSVKNGVNGDMTCDQRSQTPCSASTKP